MKMNTKMDKEGRIVLPSAVRKEVKIKPHDVLNICVQSGKIVVEKEPEHRCSVCGAEENLRSFKELIFCESCLAELRTCLIQQII